MKYIKTVFNSNLQKPDSYTVECGNHKKTFNAGEEKQVGAWVKNLWKNGELKPAYIFYNCGWDNDHCLYCRYDYEIEDMSEMEGWL